MHFCKSVLFSKSTFYSNDIAGRYSEAKTALKWLSVSEDKVESELQTLEESYGRKLEAYEDYSLLQKLRRLLKRKDVVRPLLIMMVVMLLQQFSGLSTIAYYAVTVLTDSHSSVNEVSTLKREFLTNHQCIHNKVLS